MDPLTQIRAICLALPESSERLSHGCPTPDRFFKPPYVGHRGWLGVRLSIDPDWPEITEIIRDAYRQVAPKKLAAQLD
ncbi:hypothetical protein [Nocardia sp. XZ_19_385]|uniref:hypothetical protein n=1 Tax=Nocardia sp. XZ_19_385 TaxID=2769488 RepID=UPI0035CCD4A6